MTDEVARKTQRLHDMAKEFRKTMQCNCDLDNWEPEASTGHSWVCRIHKAVIARRYSTLPDHEATP